MPTSAKVMAVSTCVALVAVSVYSVVLGGSGWLWFSWTGLLLSTTGMMILSRRT